jgi:hypothetical protein
MSDDEPTVFWEYEPATGKWTRIVLPVPPHHSPPRPRTMEVEQTPMQHEITDEIVELAREAADDACGRYGEPNSRAVMRAALEAVANRLRAQGMRIAAEMFWNEESAPGFCSSDSINFKNDTAEVHEAILARAAEIEKVENER